MPFVAESEALNAPALDLETVVQEMGAPPWRRPLIGVDSTRWVLIMWPPGFVTVPHHHPRCEEAFFILRGRASFRFANEAQQRTVGPGTLLFARRGVQHTIGVPGPEPLLFLASVTPNEDAPDEQIDDPNGVGVTLSGS